MCAVNERGCDGAFLLVSGAHLQSGEGFATRLWSRGLAIVVMGLPRPRLSRLQGESEAIVSVDDCLEWNCHHHHRTRELPAAPL